jgi:AsmA protein
MKRTLRIIGIIVAVILLVVIALPFLINVNSFRPRLESELSSALGRQVKVGNLRLSILSGSVSAEDLSITDDPTFSKNPFIRAKALDVGVEVIPLIFSKTVHITGITLDRPEISLLHSASGKWNFSSLGGSSTAKPTSASAKSGESANPNFSFSKLSVKDGRVLVGRANSAAKPQVYDQVNITVRDFSFTSQFPFTLTARLPGGGDLKLEGKAGPINPRDASMTPVQAKINVKHLDLASSGFIDPASGVAGLADFDGTLNSDGRQVRTSGTVKADKLKLAEKGSPAGRPVQLKYAVEHDLQKQAGTLSQGDISMGKALAQLTGTYQTQGESTLLNMKLNGQGMPVDELEAMLPALGVILPSGSSLKGGTLSTNLAIAGPAEKPVITGPIRLAETRLTGFNLGSKLAAISALSGAKTGSDTSIQNLSTDARVAPDGVRTENVNLAIPALGTITGTGTISPGGALNYKMNANLAGSAVTGLSQLAGLGGKGGSIPFFIQGTTSDPKFVPDVQGMLGGQLKGNNLQANPSQKSAIDALTGLFGKKKKD